MKEGQSSYDPFVSGVLIVSEFLHLLQLYLMKLCPFLIFTCKSLKDLSQVALSRVRNINSLIKGATETILLLLPRNRVADRINKGLSSRPPADQFLKQRSSLKLLSSTHCTLVNMKELKALAQFPVPHHSLHHWRDMSCPLAGISAEKGQDQFDAEFHSYPWSSGQSSLCCGETDLSSFQGCQLGML